MIDYIILKKKIKIRLEALIWMFLKLEKGMGIYQNRNAQLLEIKNPEDYYFLSGYGLWGQP